MNICFTFLGRPVPASRPRVTSRGTYTPPEYKRYKESLALALRARYWPTIEHPPETQKERTKWFKENRYALRLFVYSDRRIGDLDNYCKCLMDALQGSGILANDNQIDILEAYKFIDKENPRIEFTFKKIIAAHLP